MWWRGVQHRYKIYNLNAYIVHKRGDENLSLSLSLSLLSSSSSGLLASFVAVFFIKVEGKHGLPCDGKVRRLRITIREWTWDLARTRVSDPARSCALDARGHHPDAPAAVPPRPPPRVMTIETWDHISSTKASKWKGKAKRKEFF